MNLTESLRVSLTSLAANKLRSALTMLGIIIGVAAVIALLSVGQGVQKMVTEEIRGVGANLLFIFPGGLQSQGTLVGQSSLTDKDAQAIADPLNVPDVVAVAPQLMSSGRVAFRDKDVYTSILGATPELLPVRNFQVTSGEFFNSHQLRTKARVAVLGSQAANNLFPSGVDPVGQKIKINRISFKVIGVLEPKGAGPFGTQDNIIVVPLTTAFTRLFPQQRNLAGEYLLSTIYAQVVSEDQMEAASEEIIRLLRDRHHISLEGDDDFSVISQEDLVAILGEITGVMTLFLGAIAAISLLVGGIGIMNIMLVSVTERTREIGIRKAVGAKRRDILIQFLVEAVTISLLGGIVGILLGSLGSSLISRISEDLPTYISPGAILLGTGFSIGVGVFFGIYPAMRAARLHPIEALRYE